MTSSFFQPVDAQDIEYIRLRDARLPSDAHLVRAREFIEQIWQETAPFVDSNAPVKARSAMMPVFWEIYLAYSLRLAGIALASRAERKLVGNKGPDLATLAPEVSIEAVTPGNGEGADAVRRPPLGAGYDIPVDKMILRLRSVITDKAKIIRRYIDSGVISAGQPTIIAICGGKLEFRLSESLTPFIVRATLGVGSTIIHLGRETRSTVGESLELRDEVAKNNGSPVKTDLFLNDEFAHISALLYSCANYCCDASARGTEFVLVHNPNAINRLNMGWLKVGDEYWVEGSNLAHKLHSPRF